MATIARRRFSVEDYHRMLQAGILSEDDRVELIDGEIVEMAPIGPRHAGTVKGLAHLLWRRLQGRAIISVQDPIRLGEQSEPQPDLCLLRPRRDYYRRSHPTAADVLLVIEVAEATAEYDRQVKVPLYGRHGVAEVWLVDLEAQRVEVYRCPGAEGYEEVRSLGRGETVSPLSFPDLTLGVDELLEPQGEAA
jgi:Uma2 family endonuclease